VENLFQLFAVFVSTDQVDNLICIVPIYAALVMDMGQPWVKHRSCAPLALTLLVIISFASTLVFISAPFVFDDRYLHPFKTLPFFTRARCSCSTICSKWLPCSWEYGFA